MKKNPENDDLRCFIPGTGVIILHLLLLSFYPVFPFLFNFADPDCCLLFYTSLANLGLFFLKQGIPGHCRVAPRKKRTTACLLYNDYRIK
ncbi:MAG: hypothetical protein LBF78_14175 [Treponema sp.]|jgi:hypothetical protein|nr:hypothetical protein [Treponema sp.]